MTRLIVPVLILVLVLLPACATTAPTLYGSSIELEDAVRMAESEYVLELLSKPSEDLTEKEIAYLAMMAERQQAAQERRQAGIMETLLLIDIIAAAVALLVLVPAE